MTWTALKRPKRCESEGCQSRTHDRAVKVPAITLLVLQVESLPGAPGIYIKKICTLPSPCMWSVVGCPFGERALAKLCSYNRPLPAD